jgi:DegV family protein with EDD domain
MGRVQLPLWRNLTKGGARLTVQLITDSGADLTPEQAAACGVIVVPLQVEIDQQHFRDGVDLTPEQFYDRMRTARHLPKTSQPTPHALQAAYREALERGPVIGIHVSSALSGTWQSAAMAARELTGSIQVFDSRTGSGGMAMMVMEAAAMARDGAGTAQIIRRLEAMRAETRTAVALNTLENAVKGGRVSPLAGMAAMLLGVKPIITVLPDGSVSVADRVRGRARALDRLLEMAAAERSDWPGRRVAVAHGNCPADAEAFAARVRERFGPKELVMMPIGATIGSHAAEGAILFSY